MPESITAITATQEVYRESFEEKEIIITIH